MEIVINIVVFFIILKCLIIFVLFLFFDNEEDSTDEKQEDVRFRETEDFSELSDIETLSLRHSCIHIYNMDETLDIGIIEEDALGDFGTISLIMAHWDKEGKCTFLQANLLENEIDLVINGLAKAKERMINIKNSK